MSRRKLTRLGGAARRIFDGFMRGERLTGIDMTGRPYCSAHGASRVNEMTALGIKVTKTPETRQGVHGPVRVVVYSIEPEDRTAAQAIVDALDVSKSTEKSEDGGRKSAATVPPAPGPIGQALMFDATAPVSSEGH